MFKEKRIAVVIPAYNEEHFITNVVQGLPDYVDLIIVIDDGSSDATAAILVSIDNPKLYVISHPSRKGVGSALQSGYLKALEFDMDITITLDADGQMYSNDIKALISPIVNGVVDYTKGNRFATLDVFRKMPLLRIIGNSVFSILQDIIMFRLDLWDSQCGFTAVSKNALSNLSMTPLWNDYGVYNEILFKVSKKNFRIKNIPVKTIYGQETSYISPFLHIPKILFLQLSLLLNIFQRSRRCEPVKVVE